MRRGYKNLLRITSEERSDSRVISCRFVRTRIMSKGFSNPPGLWWQHYYSWGFDPTDWCQNKLVINCRFPTTETNSKALYISWFSPPHQKLFLVTVQIFVKSADFCLQLCFSERWKKNLTKPFTPFSHIDFIENERTFPKGTTFWKWTHI